MISITAAIIFILFGFILMKYPPKSINKVYGYRTPLAMKNQDTWDEAQKHSGFIIMILGAFNGIIGVWSIALPMGINNEKVQTIILLVGVVIMMIFEEMHLKKLFNKDGSRKRQGK